MKTKILLLIQISFLFIMKIFSFDFDGTITPVPGQYSDIFKKGQKLKDCQPEIIAKKMQTIFNSYLPSATVYRLKSFFEAIYADPNSRITIQTNNYRNVVIACLINYMKIPIEYIDFDKSCFRECDHYKHTSVNELSEDSNVESIVYFEDTMKYINKVSNEKVKTVYCKNGELNLGVLLEQEPVTDSESLEKFLNRFCK